MSDNAISMLASQLGARNFLTDENEIKPYLSDWLGKFHGNAVAVAFPGSTDDVVAIMKFAAEHRYAIVPQGGNTSLSGGATPEMEGQSIILSLKRMNAVLSVDPRAQTMIVEAGCILENVQRAAQDLDMLFPLSFGAQGSSTIGGAMATSAGGTAVLRYGNARDLALGLEVVLPDGKVWNGLRPLRKDSTGYGLRHLFIGSEGTLGIITKVALRLFPQPQAKSTAYVAVDNIPNALDVLARIRKDVSDQLTAFEYMEHSCVKLISAVGHARRPMQEDHPAIVLIELSDACASDVLDAKLQDVLANLYSEGLIRDAVQAASGEQSSQFWGFREAISEALVKAGKGAKHDVSIPISCMAEFVEDTNAKVAEVAREARDALFGHLGDGNLHYNFVQGLDQTAEDFLEKAQAITRIVHDQVFRFGGSISAEHGIGRLRVSELPLYKDPVELDLMHGLKNLLDPHQLLNPGKLLVPRG